MNYMSSTTSTSSANISIVNNIMNIIIQIAGKSTSITTGCLTICSTNDKQNRDDEDEHIHVDCYFVILCDD
jgi:hypothetical protein